VTEPYFDDQRLHELLADQALFGLTAEEQDELRAMLASSSIDPQSFDYAAAMVALTFLPKTTEPLPAEIEARIKKAAEAFVRVGPQPPKANATPVDRFRQQEVKAAPPLRRWKLEAVAWRLAAALAAAFLLVAWQVRWPHPRDMSAAENRALLLKQAPDVVQVGWTATQDPNAKGATGDVVWSVDRQQGFLRVKGLLANDPQKNQYQLWIFDGHQDDRYPIDGGVFDVDSASGDVIVPIHAALRAADPRMFAITLERPGGVVVSDRKRLALLAKVPPKQG
jgi:anti-sigma-K factor RskA